MAMEKKSIKKAAPTTKSNSTKSKVDTSKPVASKVVAARKIGNGQLVVAACHAVRIQAGGSWSNS